jgi:hypothetical protein
VPLKGFRGQPLHTKRMASQVKDAAWLEWIAGLMGAGSRQTLTATLPPGRFHCLLDELPLHLIPQRQLESTGWRQNLSHQPLLLNPQCSVLPPGQVPEELEPHRDLLKNFYLQGTVAWVRDPATTSLYPFWLGRRLEAMVSSLRAGEPVPAAVPRDARFLLAAAGIVTPENHAERRIAEWAEVVSKANAGFQRKGYAPLGNLQRCAATTGMPSGAEPSHSVMCRVRDDTQPTTRAWRASSIFRSRTQSVPSSEKQLSLLMFTWRRI